MNKEPKLNYNETWKILENITNPIYIAGHIKPDQDSFCSSIALGIALKKIGKNVNILLQNNDKTEFEWLEKYDVFSFVTDTVSHNDYTFIALDLNEKKRLGEFQKYFDNASLTINIDHHQENKYEAHHTLSNPNTSATCQIIYELIESNNLNLIDKDISTFLYAGIMNDTNCFSRRLDNNTLSVAQKLINFEIDYSDIIKKTYSGRSLYELQALSNAISEIKYCGFHYLIIEKNKDCYINLTHNQIVKKLAEDIRKINEIDVFILLIDYNDKIIAKVMTNTSKNANKISELFGGGGHAKEAGFTISNISNKEILEKIKNYLNI